MDRIKGLLRCSLLSALLPVVFAAAGAGQSPTGQGEHYERDVKPILREKCYACHGVLKQEGGLRLDTAELVRRGGESGSAVVPGDVTRSLLIQRVAATDQAERMPPEGTPLTDAEIETLRAWIGEGAAGPAGEQPQRGPRDHWAFQRPARAAIPNVDDQAMINPIDVFVAAAHSQHRLVPRPTVEKSLLLRRVHLDLVGLPPTQIELQAFLADDSPDAFKRVVDRLLDSPQYGQRWARHWMDVWRYSDWYGRRMVPDVWNSAPQIWRWRDWIVRSLNDDKGYDRMIQEMLAADEVVPDDQDAGVATGYLIRNWYALNPNDWMRSNVEHTAKAFLGLTFNCAHCHDHKYDPISHEDYFRLRAFFEPIGIRQDRVAGEAAPGPFQEYQYSTLRKIVRRGAVRIYDKRPEAATWFYAGGDERNRDPQRGSIMPGVPAVLGGPPLEIRPIDLPPRAWYPGLEPGVQQTVLNDLQAAVAKAEAEFTDACRAADGDLSALREQLAQAESKLATAVAVAEKAGRPTTLRGRQSLLLDATTGRRIVQNGLPQLKSLEDGTTIRFELMILNDAHVNFQLAKDIVQGLTATFVAFDRGRIVSYRPGTFDEFDAGHYDSAAGDHRFEVALVLQIDQDRCLLTVRGNAAGPLLVDNVPVALNGWNPVSDPTKAITFDARTGSVALVDQVTVLPPETGPSGATPDAPVACFDFESPTYTDGHDVVGIDGWSASSFCQSPAVSLVSTTAAAPELAEQSQRVRSIRSELYSCELKRNAAEASRDARFAELGSAQARIAADRARYGQVSGADTQLLAQRAGRAERQAAVKNAEAAVLARELASAEAVAKPASDTGRAKQIETASKQLADARAALDKARTALNTNTPAEAYSPLSPTYPRQSTGRRRALAEWITSPQNPLTARVAINHMWLRHFHAPLVSSVFDFGRNGADPTHPELLDWLAVEFIESGWSMKHVHRLIVTSQTYRRDSSTAPDSKNATLDPENTYLWRMNPGRMEAEVVRDSLLHCAADLDLQTGGQELENSEALTTRRRSLYYSCHPEVDGKSQFGALFDAADATECYRRTRSIVPQQALALTNSKLVHQLSGKLAASLSTGPTSGVQVDSRAFIIAAFERILTRDANEAELTACTDFLQKQTTLVGGEDNPAAESRARESLVRVLFNHNDFVTIR